MASPRSEIVTQPALVPCLCSPSRAANCACMNANVPQAPAARFRDVTAAAEAPPVRPSVTAGPHSLLLVPFNTEGALPVGRERNRIYQ